jgi:hypothetical protein
MKNFVSIFFLCFITITLAVDTMSPYSLTALGTVSSPSVSFGSNQFTMTATDNSDGNYIGNQDTDPILLVHWVNKKLKFTKKDFNWRRFHDCKSGRNKCSKSFHFNRQR